MMEYQYLCLDEDGLEELINNEAGNGWRLHTIRFSSRPGAPGCGYAKCIFEKSNERPLWPSAYPDYP